MFTFIAIPDHDAGIMGAEHECLSWGVTRIQEESVSIVRIYKARAGEKKAKLHATLHDGTVRYQGRNAVREVTTRDLLRLAHGWHEE